MNVIDKLEMLADSFDQSFQASPSLTRMLDEADAIIQRCAAQFADDAVARNAIPRQVDQTEPQIPTRLFVELAMSNARGRKQPTEGLDLPGVYDACAGHVARKLSASYGDVFPTSTV